MQRQLRVYSSYIIFCWSLNFFLMFQSYPELLIIPLQFACRNMFSRFLIFNHYNWRSNQPWHIERIFSQTVYVMKKTHDIDINTWIKYYLTSSIVSKKWTFTSARKVNWIMTPVSPQTPYTRLLVYNYSQ